MAALRWVADGIETAEAAGGITLDRKQRLGFIRETEVIQRPRSDMSISGFDIATDPDPYDEE